jgi:hypothetical protein
MWRRCLHDQSACEVGGMGQIYKAYDLKLNSLKSSMPRLPKSPVKSLYMPPHKGEDA